MQLINPQLSLLFLAVIIALLLLFFSKRRRRKRMAQYADEHITKHYLMVLSPFNSLMKKLLLILALAFIIMALIRPQWDHETRETQSLGLDIIFCVDISRSMDAQDVSPSRLELSKLQLQSLLDRMESDRVGIITFAGLASLECPLTDDHSSARMVLNSLSSADAIREGSNMTDAINVAEKAFNSASGNGVLVLVSDGEDLEGFSAGKISRLAASGIKVFTLSVGTEAGAVIYHPVLQEEAFTRANLDNMQRIASLGGGSHFNVSASESASEMIMTALREGSPEELRSNQISGLKEQYHTFAFIALILLIVESLIIPLKPKTKPS